MIEMLSEDTEERGILTPDEIAGLFQLAWTDERCKIASILGAVSGMHLSEVAGLRIECVNTDKNVIVVNRSYSFYEKRLKGTKTEKPRIIYTDSSIVKMLTDLYSKNPYQDSYIFYGLKTNVPMRHETVEGQLEKMLALLLGMGVKKSMDAEWQNLAKAVAAKIKLQIGEILAIQNGNIDTDQNCLIFRYGYSFGTRKS